MAYKSKEIKAQKLIYYRALWRKEGRCLDCGAKPPLAIGKNICDKCLARDKRAWFVLSEKRKIALEHGICNVCSIRTRSKPYKTCEECRKHRRERNKIVRTNILDAYGSVCVCCGEKESRFLQIDHINNDGNIHRRQLGAKNIYSWLRQQDYPKDNYQLLCANCNYGKKINKGVCPHNDS
jgi:hypothetical protein